jgi:hypothetical protein
MNTSLAGSPRADFVVDAAAPRKRPLVDRPFLLILCFSLAYLVTWAGHLDSGDSAYRIAWAKSMLFHHTARIDDAGLGASFCKYSIGHSILAMPFLAAAEGVKRLTHVHAEGPIYMLLFILNAAIFLTLVAKYLRLRFDARQTGRTLLLLGFCTVWLPCSRMDSIEQLVLTFLFAGFLVVKLDRPMVGMLIASCAITIRPDAAIAVGLLGAWHFWNTRNWRLFAGMAAACLPALAVNAFANWVRWGTILEAGYAGEPFSLPFLTGLYGILFSAGRSILIYSPPLILGIYGVVCFAKKGRGTPDYWFFASVLISEILFYARWWDWSGDDCWANRFLTPGVMLMCIPAVEFLGGRKWPKPAACFAIAGLAVQALAVTVDPIAADYVIRNRQLPHVALYPGQPLGGTNRVDIDDLRFNPRFSPLAVNWLMLRVLLGRASGLEPALQTNPREIARTGTPLFDSLIASGWDPRSVECDLFWVRLVKNRK